MPPGLLGVGKRTRGCAVSVARSQCLAGGLLELLHFLMQHRRFSNDLMLLAKLGFRPHSGNLFCKIAHAVLCLIFCSVSTRNAVFSFTAARRASTCRLAASNLTASNWSSRLGLCIAVAAASH